MSPKDTRTLNIEIYKSRYGSIADPVNVKYDLSVVSLTGTANRRLVLPLGFRIYQYAIKLEIGHNLLVTNGNMDL